MAPPTLVPSSLPVESHYALLQGVVAAALLPLRQLAEVDNTAVTHHNLGAAAALPPQEKPGASS
jgi:hypothetical protein